MASSQGAQITRVYCSPNFVKMLFLVACTRLYTPLCPSVVWSVGWSVTLYFFYVFYSVTSLLQPKWSSDRKYGPCPSARDFGSRIRPCFLCILLGRLSLPSGGPAFTLCLFLPPCGLRHLLGRLLASAWSALPICLVGRSSLLGLSTADLCRLSLPFFFHIYDSDAIYLSNGFIYLTPLLFHVVPFFT